MSSSQLINCYLSYCWFYIPFVNCVCLASLVFCFCRINFIFHSCVGFFQLLVEAVWNFVMYLSAFWQHCASVSGIFSALLLQIWTNLCLRISLWLPLQLLLDLMFLCSPHNQCLLMHSVFVNFVGVIFPFSSSFIAFQFTLPALTVYLQAIDFMSSLAIMNIRSFNLF